MSEYIKNVDKHDFKEEVLDSKKPVFIDFWAPWCMPCRVLGSVVDLLAEDYHKDIKFVKINVEENPELSQEFNISGIPNVKIMHNQKILHDLTGVKHPDEYSSILDTLK